MVSHSTTAAGAFDPRSSTQYSAVGGHLWELVGLVLLSSSAGLYASYLASLRS